RLVLGLPITSGRTIVLATGVSAGYIGFALLLAALVGFPAPCLMLIPFVITMGVLLVLMFGIAPFRSNSPLRPHLTKFLHFLTVHVNLLSIYPLFKVIYTFVPAERQAFVLLLLPVWKCGAKKYVGRAMHELEDYIPQIVGFRCGLLQHALRLRVHVQFWLCFGVGADYCFGYFVLFVGISRASGNANVVCNLLRDNKNWSNNHVSNH
ncbi:hypothetical protein JG688_00009644, partial [Phytophthora aleatoria]